MKILRASYLGMCFGVRDAIGLDLVQTEQSTILGELVHNESILDDLRSRGVRSEQQLDAVVTSTVMITAHGASERAITSIRARGLKVLEATCPLVRFAHRTILKLAHVVADENQGRCFLHEGHKAWHFSFDTLADIADAVLSVRNLLVNKVTDALAKEQEIFVVLQGGLVQEVVNSPSHIHVMVVDYDTEGVEDDRLQKSPLNGLPCCLDHYY